MGSRLHGSELCATHLERLLMKMIRHLGKLSKPAKRAILNSGITTLEELAAISEREVAKWHGIGPRALITIRVILEENGLSFSDSSVHRK